VRVDPAGWQLHPLQVGPLARPIDVGFGPHDGRPYVLDFGHFELDERSGVVAKPGSGVLWRLPAAALQAPPVPASQEEPS
jgi:hypothetical protein